MNVIKYTLKLFLGFTIFSGDDASEIQKDPRRIRFIAGCSCSFTWDRTSHNFPMGDRPQACSRDCSHGFTFPSSENAVVIKYDNTDVFRYYDYGRILDFTGFFVGLCFAFGSKA
jgi:hypothetical protein